MYMYTWMCIWSIWETTLYRGYVYGLRYISTCSYIYVCIYIFIYIFIVYMGDNWNANGPGGVGNASYLWLPFERCPEGTIS